MREDRREDLWRSLLVTGTDPRLRRYRRVFRLLPANPRCKFCSAPFAGAGAPLMRLLHRDRWKKNPRFCSYCFKFLDDTRGGVELELSLLFADARGSTTLAERVPPAEFSRLMNRFYEGASAVLVTSDGVVDKFVGDEVIGLYLPGLAGPDHARKAVVAAQQILRATGHEDRAGPWLPVGIGVHTGSAYVGTVGGAGDITDFTALGDAVNTTARLASEAGQGEILVTDATAAAASMSLDLLERRRLHLRGRTEAVDVLVLRVVPAARPDAVA